MTIDRIHGLPVVAWVETEVQAGKTCGIVMVEKGSAKDVAGGYRKEYVTAWYREGDHEWSTGNYFGHWGEAWQDFKRRVEREKGIR